MAGVYGDYNGYLDKVGSQGGYWTSTSNPNRTGKCLPTSIYDQRCPDTGISWKNKFGNAC